MRMSSYAWVICGLTMFAIGCEPPAGEEGVGPPVEPPPAEGEYGTETDAEGMGDTGYGDTGYDDPAADRLDPMTPVEQPDADDSLEPAGDDPRFPQDDEPTQPDPTFPAEPSDDAQSGLPPQTDEGLSAQRTVESEEETPELDEEMPPEFDPAFDSFEPFGEETTDEETEVDDQE